MGTCRHRWQKWLVTWQAQCIVVQTLISSLGHAHVYQTVQALKTIPLFSFLNTYKNKCRLWSKMIYNNKADTFNMTIKPCILMDQSGAPCAVSLSCDINMGQEPIRLHKLSQVFKNVQYNQLRNVCIVLICLFVSLFSIAARWRGTLIL